MKLKCVIIDDEHIAREGLVDYVEKVDYLELAGTLPHALNASTFLRDHQPDLLYLDIQMPDLSGLEFLRTLSQPPMVIFTTAHRKFAVEGFELDAVDYLMKPISFERFLKASNKALQLKENQTHSPSEEYFFIKSGKQYIKINFEEITFIESAKDYVFIFTEDQRHMALLTLKQIEDKLPSQLFLRVHRSYMVAISAIDRIEGNRIKIGEHEIPISRNLQEHVFDQLINKRLWKRGG